MKDRAIQARLLASTTKALGMLLLLWFFSDSEPHIKFLCLSPAAMLLGLGGLCLSNWRVDTVAFLIFVMILADSFGYSSQQGAWYGLLAFLPAFAVATPNTEAAFPQISAKDGLLAAVVTSLALSLPHPSNGSR